MNSLAETRSLRIRLSANTYKLLEGIADELNVTLDKLVSNVVEVFSDYMDVVLAISDEFNYVSKVKLRRLLIALDDMLRMGDVGHELYESMLKNLNLYGKGLVLEDMGWGEKFNSLWMYFTITSPKLKWVDDLYLEFTSDNRLISEVTSTIAFTEALSSNGEKVVSKVVSVLNKVRRWGLYKELAKYLSNYGIVHSLDLSIEKNEFSINLLLHSECSSWSCVPDLELVNKLFRNVMVRSGISSLRRKLMR